MQNRWPIVLVLFLSLLLVSACGDSASPDSTQAAADAALVQETENVVSATGEVRPARWANLSLAVGGTVEGIYAEDGQRVSTGDLLAEVDAVQLDRTVAEVQAALSAAEADLARITAGAHPQDIAASAEAVRAAQANVKVAEGQVQAAEAGRDQALTGVAIARAQKEIAEAGVKVAEAELSRSQVGASRDEITGSRAALDKARAGVRQAQSDYDRTGGESNRPEALLLEQATLDLEAAQAAFDQLLSGPRQADLAPLRANIAAMQAQVPLAVAQIAQAESLVAQAEVGVSQGQAAVEAAQTQVGQAQAALDRLEAGATDEEVAVAEAAVAQTREALTTAQTLMAEAKLTAPFAGTVGMVYAREGEELLPGQSVLVLGDLSTLRVETTDLDEIDVARIEPDQEVELTFDALPEEMLAGRVSRVAPMSSPGQGATTYAVIIEFDKTDPALRWGMTAFVDILTE